MGLLSHDNEAPFPPALEKLTVTDSKQEVLNRAFHNCKTSGLPSSKLDLNELDWRQRLPREMKNRFDLILGSDIAYQYPDVKHIARTVAYALKGEPYTGNPDDKEDGGKFLLVGPQNRDTITDLRKKLRTGYRMDSELSLLELRRYDLAPMILDSAKNEPKAESDLISSDTENGGQKGFVEFQNQVNSKFTVILASHHMDYDGYNGEYFFPAETGAEEDGAPTRWVGNGNVERDENYGKTDGGKGSWYME